MLRCVYTRLTWTHTCMHACLSTSPGTAIDMHAYIHTYRDTTYANHARIRTLTHTDIRTYIHAYMHACMHAYIHTYLRFNVNMASVKQGGNLTSNQYDISVVRRFRGQPTKQHAINSAFGSSYVPPKRYIAEELSLTPHQFWAYRSFWCGSFPACCTF